MLVKCCGVVGLSGIFIDCLCIVVVLVRLIFSVESMLVIGGISIVWMLRVLVIVYVC